MGMEGAPEDFECKEVNSERKRGSRSAAVQVKDQAAEGGRALPGKVKVTAVVLGASPAQGAEWQQDGYPYADELSPFPGARPMGGMPRTRLTQVTWGGCWDCYRRSPEWTHFPPLRIPLSILYKPPGSLG